MLSPANVAGSVESPQRPTAQMPSLEWSEKLNNRQRQVVHHFLNEPLDCVFHAGFKSARTERQLFGSQASEQADALKATPCFSEDQKIGGVIPTLTIIQERMLFERYNYARYRVCEILRKYADKRLSLESAKQFLRWGELALQARAQIIQLNVPLVLSMAKRSRLGGLDFSDLISEGNLALIRSVEKFDTSRGFKFSTYACRAILKSFSRLALKVSRYRGFFPVELNMELEPVEVQDQKRLDVENDCLEELKHILSTNRAQLSEVEKTVIEHRFALGGLTLEKSAKTLEEVGAVIGVTKERVRQIQNKALDKIKLALEQQVLVA